jgi:bifunctional enzyme CysN/CysC
VTPSPSVGPSRQLAGATVWLTGLSGAGKSTIGAALVQLLDERGRSGFVLDGDDLRDGLNVDLGFSEADRAENVRRVAEVALLLARVGYVTVVTVISPYAAGRRHARERHETSGIAFLEVHVATPVAVCESRDPKGLYARARAGEIERFTGITDPYEAPLAPELVLSTEGRSPLECASQVLEMIDGLGI